LGLGREDEIVILLHAQEAAHTGDEIGDVLVAEGVVEREHGLRMHDLRKFLRWPRTHALRRAVGPDELREARLDLVVAALQGIVVRIADRGRVLTVIATVVFRDLAGETLKLLRRVRGGELVGGFPGGRTHARLRIFLGGVLASAIRRRAAARASSVTMAPDSM